MVRVLLADDSLLVRQGIASLVGAIDGVEMAGEASDLNELMQAIDDVAPDVVITDIRMPPTHTDEGIRAAIDIRRRNPGIGVVVLSQYAEPSFVLELFENGSEGLGYLLKDRVGPSDLERAVRSVADGGSSVDARIVEVLVASKSQQPSPIDHLTPREREVLGCIAEGLNNTAVAETLVISSRAVARHINSIFAKLALSEDEDAHRRVKAVLMWLSEGS